MLVAGHSLWSVLANAIVINCVVLFVCEHKMESYTDSLEDMQRVSSRNCVLDAQTESPEPKRRCTLKRFSASTLQFSSSSEIDESSDGALFPSDHSTSSSANSCARYPSEVNEQSPQTDFIEFSGHTIAT